MNINGCRMMEMKKAGYSGGLNKMSLIIMVLIGLTLVTQGCSDEIKPRDYPNVNRELVLNEFEVALSEAGKGLEKLMQTKSSDTHSERALWIEDEQRNGQLRSLLKPILSKSISLLETYGITQDFVEKELGDPNDPRIVVIGVWLAETERRGLLARHTHHVQRADFGFFFQEKTLSEDRPDWMDCMIIAVGVDAIIEFAKGNVTEAIAKKAIRKIASRTLGWVGVALALYEYGSCMEWY